MKKPLMQTFSDWLKKPLGQDLLKEEQQKIISMLKNRRFNLAALIGDDGYQSLIERLLVNDFLLVTEDKQAKQGVVAKAEFLPIQPNTLDLVVLPHTLDFSKRPYRVLREADYCMRGDGNIVIVGFSAFGLWHLRQFFSFRRHGPWCARFHAMWKIKDWLRVLNYKVIQDDKLIYRLPVKTRKAYKHLSWASRLLEKFLPFSGAVYIIVAKKRVLGVTPINARWSRVKGVLSNNGIVTTRNING